MKFFIDNWFLFLTALVSGGLLLWPKLAGGGAMGRVSPAEAVQLINREKAVLIDVCEPAEFAAGHAAGARNVPLAQIGSGKGLPANKSLPLAQLRKAGYEQARSLSGGTKAWREANLPIEKAA